MKPRFRSLRAAWHGLLGASTVRLDGIALRVADMPDTVRRQLLRGEYEFAERRLARQALRPDDRVVEIGAGIGAVGLLAARLAAEVTSYEANPAAIPTIEANHDQNAKRPNLVPKAVTRDGGPLRFFAMDNIISSGATDRGGTEIEVESVALSDVIAERRPTVIVMDIEGAETEVLETPLDGVRALILETHAKIVGQDATDAMLGRLRAAGFSIKASLHNNVLLER